MYGAMQEEEVRLYVLHGIVRTFQWLARTAGVVALLTENRYNEIVETLH